jgi:hypothetical protein
MAGMNITILIAWLASTMPTKPFCDIRPDVRQRMGLPAGDCKPLSLKPTTGTASLTWCCGFDGTPCYQVPYVSDCNPSAQYAVSCEWGQSNADGTITCYG